MTGTARLLLLPAIACTLAAGACKNKKTEDKSHLSPKVMRQLLLDVNVAEVYSTFQKDSLNKLGGKNLDSLAVYYKSVFAHYNVTPEQFTENLEWYKDHPDDLDTIYNDMLPTVNAMQAAAPKTSVPAPAPPIPVPPVKK